MLLRTKCSMLGSMALAVLASTYGRSIGPAVECAPFVNGTAAWWLKMGTLSQNVPETGGISKWAVLKNAGLPDTYEPRYHFTIRAGIDQTKTLWSQVERWHGKGLGKQFRVRFKNDTATIAQYWMGVNVRCEIQTPISYSDVKSIEVDSRED